VKIRKDDARIVLESVEDAIAVMRIDVHVRHARHAAPAQQGLDHHAAIV